VKHIEFWFSIGSTYTYLTVSRIERLGQESGIHIDWRPFSVRALMQEMNNMPFAGKPAKEKYMWRDLERRAAMHGIPIRLPVEYPLQHFDLANRIAVLGQQEGWCIAYVKRAYELWFQEGLAPGGADNLAASIEAAGQQPDRVIALAASDLAQQAYEAATGEARERGIFGSPSFIVGQSELFWGDDRLEDAIHFCRRAG